MKRGPLPRAPLLHLSAKGYRLTEPSAEAFVTGVLKQSPSIGVSFRLALADSPANLPAVTLPVADPLPTSTLSFNVDDAPVFQWSVTVALAVPEVQERVPAPFPRRVALVTPPPEQESSVPRV